MVKNGPLDTHPEKRPERPPMFTMSSGVICAVATCAVSTHYFCQFAASQAVTK
jgi:hypothetical protein